VVLDIVAVSLAVASGICGLVGAQRPSIRVWLVHLVSVAAMVWMALPPALTEAVGRQVWAGALLALMLWTVFAQVITGRAPRIVAAREIADLVATSVLVMLTPAAHHLATPLVSSAHGHEGGPAVAASVPIVVVLLGWAAIVAACAVVRHRTAFSRRRDALGSSSAALMLAGMGLMAGMSFVS
jgi:hypothetical protein